MIKSMTGFASVTREDDRATIAVTIRALNHRHLDLQLRMPQSLAAIESDVRALVAQARRARPRRAEPVAAAAADARASRSSSTRSSARRSRRRSSRRAHGPGHRRADARRSAAAAAGAHDPRAADRYGRRGRRRRLPVARVQPADRRRAGRSRHDAHRPKAIICAPDLDQRRALVADLVERIASAADEGRAAMEQRLAERVARAAHRLQADETAVAQEIVRMAARSDISEEVARFRGHVVALGDARRQRRAVRAQARFPAAGDEPRGEHDGLEGRRPARVRAHHRRQGGAREDARAGPECRVGARGLLFIVSAPSGAGKTTLVERLVEQTPSLKMSRSYTSRPARAGRNRRRGL